MKILNENIYYKALQGTKKDQHRFRYMYVYMYVYFTLRAWVRAASPYRYIYIMDRSRQSLGVNVNVALPSVGSVVPWDMTHAITGRRGALYQLLAIATTRGGPRCEIQRIPPHTHTAPNNIHRQNRDSLTRLIMELLIELFNCRCLKDSKRSTRSNYSLLFLILLL